ncbi:CDP-alcohol phosphatidyltransferase family protein [Gephyromycinifex aptenodytis]|uniref:CDP-alcohol phosphatidyltransferase family protein n=1 Tax=Gephyromycinifex aptenodytis TaxID=2716227 RepID=UPI001D02D318|nr:CDP-alcohol phosphatidyltransferase family protein [Gephyromycinifex aptenodytis]
MTEGKDMTGSRAAHQEPSAHAVPDRVFTVPNMLTMLRLAGVPVFLWLLTRGESGWAVLLLVVSGLTDYADGAIARRWHQVSRLGQVLDPVADRLYILATILGLWWFGTLPGWFVLALLARDAFGSLVVWAVRRRNYRGLPVHLAGKAGTFCLLIAFPTLLLSDWLAGGSGEAAALAAGWALAWWGLFLYWVSGLLYGVQALQLRRREQG